MHTYYFEKLNVWQNAKTLAVAIYSVTSKFPSTERFELSDQLRRSVISISANIAEGSTRGHSKDYQRFLNIAYGSTIEVLNHLLIAKELEYISDETLADLRTQIGLITNQLRALQDTIISDKHDKGKLQQP